jgi:hypothetical protein
MGGFNVYLGFGRTHGEVWQTLGDLVLGSHFSVALFVDTDEGCSMFTVTVNSGRFEETALESIDQQGIRDLCAMHDFLHVSSSADEHDRVLRTCRACVRAKLVYNYHDVLLMNVPFRSPVEKTIFEVSTLHDSQAAILILRECVQSVNPALPVLRGLHSRNTLCCQLYKDLALVCARKGFTVTVNGGKFEETAPFAASGIMVREPVQSRGNAH